MIIAIAAVAKDWGIGKQNGLLFKLPDDLKFYKNQTEGNIVVMGYNTLLSLPKAKPLPNRVTIVLCPEGVEPEGCIVYHKFEKLVKDLKILSAQYNIYVSGGATLYYSLLSFCDKCLITQVDATDPEATAFFPNLDRSKNFEVVYTGDIREDNGYLTQLVEYQRRK